MQQLDYQRVGDAGPPSYNHNSPHRLRVTSLCDFVSPSTDSLLSAMARTSAAVPIIVGIALFLSVVVAFAAVLAIVSAEEAVQPDNAAGGAGHPAEAMFEEVKAEKEAGGEAKLEEEPEVVELPDEATLLKMKVRELKAILAKKGPDAACLACTSKAEFVERIRDTADWPVVAEKKEENQGEGDDAPSMEELRAMFSKGRDDEQMKELKKNLKAAGIDTSNIFATGGGLDSEKFAEQFKKWDLQRAPDAQAKEEAAKVDL